MAQVEIFLYVDKTSKNPDRITSGVPFKVSDRHIFFGPGETAFRKELRDRFLTYSDKVVPQNDIYMVGVNEVASNDAIRKILWVGKINRVMSFEVAYKLLQDPEFQTLDFVPDAKNPEKNVSPLHIEPAMIMGNLSGYRHRSEYHSKVSRDGIPDWAKDVMDPRDKAEFSIAGKELMIADISRRKKVLRRDCCFTCDNIFFADGQGMAIEEGFVKLLDERQPGQGADATAIFGYSQARGGKRTMNKQKGSALHIRWRVADEMLEYIMSRV